MEETLISFPFMFLSSLPRIQHGVNSRGNPDSLIFNLLDSRLHGNDRIDRE
jgi:hypothetical protein